MDDTFKNTIYYLITVYIIFIYSPPGQQKCSSYPQLSTHLMKICSRQHKSVVYHSDENEGVRPKGKEAWKASTHGRFHSFQS